MPYESNRSADPRTSVVEILRSILARGVSARRRMSSMVVARETIVIFNGIDAGSIARFAVRCGWRLSRDTSLLFSLRENVSVGGQVSARGWLPLEGVRGFCLEGSV